MDKKPFYITSPIFYPNANLHIGHAYTMVICDIIARYNKTIGNEVYFLTGTDENTAKILKSTNVSEKEPSKLLEIAAENFKGLYKRLNIEFNDFIRTTDQKKHWPGAIKMWNALKAAGDIESGVYKGLYCIGCETFYTEKDLVDGKCPIHLTTPEKIEEKNYFFKLSKYTDKIKKKIESDELKIVPQTRKNEILALFERGLEDVSFSRPRKVVPHGIPVPGDPDQVIYVWCDALVNYISALGYGTNNTDLFNKFWPANVHVIGKDILRFHAAIWPAMLMSAGLELPKQILVHGLITSGGHKMSKSLGNVIDPDELITEFGAEAVRYYLARVISPFEDGDLTKEHFKAIYNSDLANGLGNLVSRIMKMAESNKVSLTEEVIKLREKENPVANFTYRDSFERCEFNKACEEIWYLIRKADGVIQEHQPFKLVKTDFEKAKKYIHMLLEDLFTIAKMLEPIIPQTAEKIKSLIKANKSPEKPLFPRKD